MAAPYLIVTIPLLAGEEKEVPFPTDYVALIDATDADAVTVRLNDEGRATPLISGLVPDRLAAPRFWIGNTSAAPNTVRVAIGSGTSIIDNRQLNGVLAQDINLKQVGGAAFAQGQRSEAQSISVVPALNHTALVENNNGKKRSYTVLIDGAAPTSANYVLAAIEAGAAVGFRLRRLTISIPGSQTTAGRQRFELVRTTAASAAGVATTPQPRDLTDAAFSGIAKITNPTITAGVSVFSFSLVKPTAVTTAPGFTAFQVSFDELNMKPIIVPAGIVNGIALREINGAAGAANFCATLEITEE